MAERRAPVVVRLRRKGGRLLTPYDEYIGRAVSRGGWDLPSSRWANPFSVAALGREAALAKYSEWIRRQPDLLRQLPSLSGKRLGCWCAPAACHGDILVELFLAGAPPAPRGVPPAGGARFPTVPGQVPGSPGAGHRPEAQVSPRGSPGPSEFPAPRLDAHVPGSRAPEFLAEPGPGQDLGREQPGTAGNSGTGHQAGSRREPEHPGDGALTVADFEAIGL